MPNRTLCEVLNEMRTCYETRNFSYLKGLIEEAQSMGNRMEAALGDKRDLEHWRDECSRLKKQVNDLRQKSESLKAKRNKDE